MKIAINALIYVFIIGFLLGFSRKFTGLITTMWTLYNGIRTWFSTFFISLRKKHRPFTLLSQSENRLPDSQIKR